MSTSSNETQYLVSLSCLAKIAGWSGNDVSQLEEDGMVKELPKGASIIVPIDDEHDSFMEMAYLEGVFMPNGEFIMNDKSVGFLSQETKDKHLYYQPAHQ